MRLELFLTVSKQARVRPPGRCSASREDTNCRALVADAVTKSSLVHELAQHPNDIVNVFQGNHIYIYIQDWQRACGGCNLVWNVLKKLCRSTVLGFRSKHKMISNRIVENTWREKWNLLLGAMKHP